MRLRWVMWWLFAAFCVPVLPAVALRLSHSHMACAFKMSRGFWILRILSAFDRYVAFVELLGGILTISLRFAVV